MTDITTRLRGAVNEIMCYQFTHGRPAMNALQVLIDDAEAAADEIERLREALDTAGGALSRMDPCATDDDEERKQAHARDVGLAAVRAALGGT